MGMFVRGVGRVDVIMAVLGLIHNAGLKRFVCRMTTAADRERQDSHDQGFTVRGDHDSDGLTRACAAFYLLTRLNVGD